jgi:hypothetical protein
MFLDNASTTQYQDLITTARNRLPIGSTRKQAKLLLIYTERHHIIPKSMGGSDIDTNLVWLTAEEHLAVHLLLPKMVSEEKNIRKMSLAAVRMANPQSNTQKRIIGDNLIPEIAAIRQEAARLHSVFMSKRHCGENNPFFGKRHTDKTKEIQRKSSAERVITAEMRVNYSTGRKKFYQDYPEKKPTGNKNPRFNDTVYHWENIFTYEQLFATRHEMINFYPALKSNISQVINKNYNHVKGWKIVVA